MMTLHRAQQMCREADKLWWETYQELCVLKHEHASGYPSDAQHPTLAYCETHVKQRLQQINTAREQIAELTRIQAETTEAKSLEVMMESLKALRAEYNGRKAIEFSINGVRYETTKADANVPFEELAKLLDIPPDDCIITYCAKGGAASRISAGETLTISNEMFVNVTRK